MRKSVLFLLSSLLLLTSCSYRQFGAVATGSSLGGMFGSSIGGLMGGPRGSDKGTLAGMVIGGAVGAAVTAPRVQNSNGNSSSQSYSDNDTYYRNSDGVQYDSYNNSRYRSPEAVYSDLQELEVSNIYFLDENNNRQLDTDEQAYLIMDIYNAGQKTLYNVAPQITCNSKRVVVSPAATIASIAPGQGVRYKAAVRAYRKLKDGQLVFTISFGTGKQKIVTQTIRI